MICAREQYFDAILEWNVLMVSGTTGEIAGWR